ncbi:MAG: hydantoinase/oxoprolinase family protein [Thaumarchaeota archaeon]|nr:hydantoinase/oxoprolinase family protein [Nitrososphaerota archaeon]
MIRLAVDIGGTFTDAVILDEETQTVNLSKVPSTPDDYSQGVLTSIRRLRESMSGIENFVHGTTVGTNAIIQGAFKNAALLGTEGFRDVLEIGRGNRVDMYDPFYRMPEPLIARDKRIEIHERMSSTGAAITPLDLETSRNLVRSLVDSGVNAIAVCLINSYANSTHEERLASLIRELYPSVLVSISTEITNEYNEYERTSTTVINTLLLHIMNRYLGILEEEISRIGFPGKLMLMQSNGGLMTASLARKIPVHTINSGLVGGILAVKALGSMIGIQNLIGADMGGTSFDVELVIDGRYETTPMMRIMTPKSGPDGYPLLIPAVDIHAIGTGGGSIAWIDKTGSMHVGPMSASAFPGPACYGKGGKDPTVTDANLILGRLNPGKFLGGEMKVYPELARSALKHITDYYSMDILEAAEGILKIAVPNMASAIRTMTVERGIDPRGFSMVSFGGAGPLHANLIARELQIGRTFVSTMPGNFSAWGMLTADFRRDYVLTRILSMEKLEISELEERFAKLETHAEKILLGEGISKDRMVLIRALDMRYVGQGHALTLQLPRSKFNEKIKGEIESLFDNLHLKRYLHNAPSQPKELVAIRLSSIGQMKKASLSKIKSGTIEPPSDSLQDPREVYIDGSFKKCKIYDRSRLLANNLIHGPSIIEERVSTTLLLDGYVAEVDPFGHLVISGVDSI